MDEIRATLATFSEDDRREFTHFIQRQKKKKDRKDLDLAQLLMQPKALTTAQLLKRLYPDEPNPTAYYALRKRLMNHITSFILLKRFESDTTAAAPIMGLISLARYLFDAGLSKLAWQHLRKAEKMAADNEQFDLLNTIYNLQLEQIEDEFAPDLEELIEKRNRNKAAADEEERANIANSLINRKLQQNRQQGRDLHFDSVIYGILEQCGVNEAVSKRPSLLYKLMAISRSVLLMRKDYYHFEPYIIKHYERMAQRKGFLPVHRSSQLGLLYMIAHVLYRNRKFGQAGQYLIQMEELLREATQAQQAHYYPRYVFLHSVCSAFLGDLKSATLQLEELLEKRQALLSSRTLLTAYLQLSFYYFSQQDFVRAWRLLQSMPYSEKWCEKQMGRDWVLKKRVGELIIQFELQNYDLAMARLEAIARDFKDILAKPAYTNEQAFLKLLSRLIDQPDYISRPGFLETVEQTISFQPIEQEDLSDISFYAWLKSKMVKTNYFDQLREFALAEPPKTASA